MRGAVLPDVGMTERKALKSDFGPSIMPTKTAAVVYFKPSKEVRDRLEKISTGQVLGGMDKTKTPPL
jgi:hypothetical protein